MAAGAVTGPDAPVPLACVSRLAASWPLGRVLGRVAPGGLRSAASCAWLPAFGLLRLAACGPRLASLFGVVSLWFHFLAVFLTIRGVSFRGG